MASWEYMNSRPLQEANGAVAARSTHARPSHPSAMRSDYFCVTFAIANPPTLLWAAREGKLPVTLSCPTNLPTFTSGMVPTSNPVEGLNICKVETLSVLVASTVTRPFFTTYSAFVTTIVAVSFRMDTEPLRVFAPSVPDTATEVFAATCRAPMGKVAVAAPGVKATLAGTVRIAEFALARLTTVPFDAGPLSVTVATAASPPNIPIKLAGATDIEATVNAGTTSICVANFVNR